MPPSTVVKAFSTASSAISRGVDAASTIHVLVHDCVDCLGARAGAVLIRTAHGQLEPLAATSRDVELLETVQT